MKFKALLHQRVIAPIAALLRVGVTPRRIALSIATGTIVGVFPLLGTTTALCVALSLGLRLNIVAMQAFNWLVAGMQLLLILPFIRLGEKLYNATPLPLTPREINALFDEGFVHAIQSLGLSLLHAVSGWLLVAPIVFGLTYAVALRTVGRMAGRRSSETAAA